MSNTSEILNEIYSKINKVEVFKELNPKEKGDYVELDCPFCLEHGAAFIYKNGCEIQCNRNINCGQKTTLWNYVQNKNNYGQQETLKELASLANVYLPATTNGKDFQQLCDKQIEENLLTQVLAFYKKQLFEECGKTILEYLTKERGYSINDIQKMELGYNPGHKATLEFLKTKAFLPSDIERALKFLEFRDDHPLVFPYRDKFRQITSLWGRTLDRNTDKKYLPYSDTKKDFPFNIDKTFNAKELVAVEGFFDSMIATARGLKNVIGLGGSHLTKPQLDIIIKGPCKRIYLALDNDTAGVKGTEKSIELLNETNIEIFVVTLPDGIKDPDELIVKHGIDVLATLIDNASSISSWLPKRITEKYNLQTDIGYKDALNEAVSVGKQIKNRFESDKFLKQVADTFDVPLETLTTEIDTAKKEDQKKLQLKKTEDYLSKASQLFKDGKINELSAHLIQNKPILISETNCIEVAPYTIDDLRSDLAMKLDGLKTGYSELDKLTRISNEAITLVGGRPSHGKTTFKLNLFVNMILEYPEQYFYFFSYEETRQQIAIKIINILSKCVIDKAQNISQIQGYIKSGSRAYPDINKGMQLYNDLVMKGRLRIVEATDNVQDLSQKITHLKSTVPLGAVFIDYIQKIKNKNKKLFGTRQLELQNTSEIILETVKTNSLPIILGAQLGRGGSGEAIRLENLRESGDLEQDANLVLGIYNPSMEVAQKNDEKCFDREVELQVTLLKNRNGAANQTIKLKFDRPILKIKNWEQI